MRHFGHISPAVREGLFHQEPCEFSSDSPAWLLSAALGATLYSPATRPRLADDVVKQTGRGVVSMVLCLEDSIHDSEVEGAEANLVRQFKDLEERGAEAPCCSSGSGNRSRFPTSYGGWEPPSGCCPDLYFPNSPRSAGHPSWKRSSTRRA